MKKDVQKYKVTIAGESYFLVSDEPEERVREVANYVDGQIRAIAQAGYSDDPQRLAILVALQSTSKMMHNTELLKKHQALSERMIERISEAVPSDALTAP